MNDVFTITKVDLVIKDKKNFIQFYLNKKYINYINYINYISSTHRLYDIVVFPFKKRLEKYLGISLLEIELLINSSLKPVFFKPGEVLPNGSVAKQSNHKYYIKSWKIVFANSLDKIRETNDKYLFKFEKISNISILKTYNNLIHISVEKKHEPYLYTIGELVKVSCLKNSQFNLLHSSYISPICYKESEISNITGWIIPKNPHYNNTIIKEINLRVPLFTN